MTERRLLAVGLNPVAQKTLDFAELRVGKVNRADSILLSSGGKGTHCARAVNQLQPGACSVVHFIGGSSGERLAENLEREGIPQILVRIPDETRGCTTLLDQKTGVMTELVDPSPNIPPDACNEMRDKLSATMPTADGIALCGTFPPGIDPAFYAWIAGSKGNAVLLLDGYRGIEPTLETGAVDILKINRDEIVELTGKGALPDAVHTLQDTYGTSWVAVTDGPGNAMLWGQGGSWEYRLPTIDDVINPLGAGDTASGVTLLRTAEGMSVPEAFGWGLAAACASCRQPVGACFRSADMDAVHAETEVIRRSP